MAFLPESSYQTRQLSAGEYLFHQGQEVNYIYGIQNGRVHLFRDLPDGSSVSLHVAQSGQTFAEAALFVSHYHCHAKVEIESEVLCINAHVLKELLSESSSLSLDILQLLAGQIRDLRAQLMLRDIRSADDRLLTWLRLRGKEIPAQHSCRDPLASRSQLEVPIVRTWSAIAEELGLTREAIYRSLAKLERKGIVIREKASVWLNDETP